MSSSSACQANPDADRQIPQPDHERDYFDSYEDLQIHRLMLEDVPRTTAYQRAILDQKDFFKNKVVMDVGAGSGILSLFCYQAGAKRVYAVEASGMAHVLKDVVEANGAGEVIKVLHCRAEEVELPDQEKVDVIVSEWMGFYLLHESMLQSVLVARDRHLKEDDGVMMPSHARLWACACTCTSANQGGRSGEDNDDSFWGDNVYGFDMRVVQKFARQKRHTRPQVKVIGTEQLLTEPQLVCQLDLKGTTAEELSLVQKRHFASVTRSGDMSGLALWFDCHFRPSDVELSTAPMAQPTHWKQTIILLPESDDSAVETDDVVGWEVQLCPGQDNPRHYAIQVGLLDPANEDHPIPCHCQMAKCVLIQKLVQMDEEQAEGDDVDQ